MAAINDFMKKNVKFAYGGLGLPFAALDIKNILDSDNKLKAILKTMKDLILVRVSLVGTFAAVGAAVKALVKDTGSLDAALKRLSQVQHFQRLFAPFIGGAKAARKEVADLLQFAAHTPFKFEGVAQAALTLQKSTRGQFAGEPALKKLGDAAAVSGNSIEDSAQAVGQFYEALRNGEPINQTVEAMRQMGLISTQAATNMERLAESGGDAQGMAKELTAALDESRGGMKGFADDLESVAEAREKAVEGAKVAFGAAFSEREVNTTKNYTEAIVAITPALSKAGEALSGFVGGIESVTSVFVKWITQSGIGSAVIGVITVAVIGFTVALIVIGAAALPAFSAFIATLAASAIAATAGMGALSTAIAGVVSAAAGVAIALPWIAATVAVIGLGVALVQAIQHQKNFNKALAEEAAAHAEIIRSIHAHIVAIQTLADKYQVVSEAVQQQIKDQSELNNLLAKREALRASIARSGGPGINIGMDRELADTEQKIEQQRKKIATDRAARQRAERTPAIAGPERAALIQLQTRRELLMEEQRLEEAISREPGRAPELQRQRAGVLSERAAAGRAGVEAREQIALRRSALSTGRGEAEAQLASYQQQVSDLEGQAGKEGELLEAKKQVTRLQTLLDKIDGDILKEGLKASEETSVGLETRAQMLQHAINAKAAQEAGRPEEVRREKLLAGGAVAGPNAPAQILDLQKRAELAKTREAAAPETEIEARRKMLAVEEAERTKFISELQIHIERGIVNAARQGPPGQKELLTDLRSFISKFEDLRKIFPDQKAAALAMEQVGTDIMNFPAEALKPVADSLTRVGGGGGVGGPTGDPRLIAQQRLMTLQQTANTYLDSIDKTLKKAAAPPPKPGTQAASSPNTVAAWREAQDKASKEQRGYGTLTPEIAERYGLDVNNPNIDVGAVMNMEQNRVAAEEYSKQFTEAQEANERIPETDYSGLSSGGIMSTAKSKWDPADHPSIQTNRLLGNILNQNKQSNDHLGTISTYSADQGKSF
jgi:hypothetical protein